jgi:RHS repeat-associated protein
MELHYGPEDHLGSTRMVIDGEVPEIGSQSFTVQEATFYYSYGKMNTFFLPAIDTREKFTGKEFDQEGKTAGANGAAGIEAYHFGARMYDSEVGVWWAVDPKEQFWNPYAYHNNPIRYVDPNGEIFLQILKALSPTLNVVTKIASAYNAIKNENNFYRKLGAMILDNIMGGFGDITGPVAWGGNAIVSTFNNWGNGDKWGNQAQAIWDNEIVSFRNTFKGSSNFREFSSNVTNAGVNDLTAGLFGFQYGFRKDARYYGIKSDERGYSAVVMGYSDMHDATADAKGNHIRLQSDWHQLSDEGGLNSVTGKFTSTKGSVIRHELTHVGQSARFGGAFDIKLTHGVWRKDYSDKYSQEAFDTYGRGRSYLNELEFEAQLEEMEWKSE